MLIHAGNYEPTSDFWLWNKSKLENKISTGSKYGTKTLNIKALINFELDLNKIQNFKRKEILVLWTHLKAQSSGDLILQVIWIEEEEAGKVKSNLLCEVAFIETLLRHTNKILEWFSFEYSCIPPSPGGILNLQSCREYQLHDVGIYILNKSMKYLMQL